MPWNPQGGGNQGPWGSRPGGGNGSGGGGGGQQPPDLEELIRKSQEKVKQLFPGGGRGGSGGGPNRSVVFGVGALVLVAFVAYNAAYRVNADEQGVVTRFGEYVRTEPPGLQFKIPLIEAVEKPRVTRSNRVEIGFRGAGAAGLREVDGESLMLTGDENIVDINFVVLWQISDAGNFLFNVRQPEETVKAAAESVMREIIGKTPIAEATTEGRNAIQIEVRQQIQALLDSYSAGIQINQVQLQKVDPPNEVIDAFRDVQRAQADRERLRNEAEAYANDLLPRARGEAEQMLQQAEAFREEVVAQSEGEAERFNQVFAAYQSAQDVTTRRLYLETMEDVLRDMNKVILDEPGGGQGGGNGVVPYLPLNELMRGSSATNSGSAQQ